MSLCATISHGPHSSTYRFTAASTLRITYGYTAKKEDDELLEIANTAMEQFSLSSAPGAYLADAFPIRLLLLSSSNPILADRQMFAHSYIYSSLVSWG